MMSKNGNVCQQSRMEREIFAYLLDFMVGVACGLLPGAVHLLRVSRTVSLRNDWFSVLSAKSPSQSNSYRSCTCGSLLEFEAWGQRSS